MVVFLYLCYNYDGVGIVNKYCINCGYKNNENASFCTNCGSRLKNMIEHTNEYNSNKNNRLKTTSLIIGIISIFLSLIINVLVLPLSLVGFILGLIYIIKYRKFCIGIVLNIVSMIFAVLIVILLMVVTKNIINDSYDKQNNNDNYYGNSYEKDDDYEDNDYYNYDNNDITDGVYFKEISADNLLNKFQNRDTFVLLISQTSCHHCNSYKPKLENVANKYKIETYYIEYNLISYDDELVLNDYINWEEISGTPTTMFFKNGKDMGEGARIVGDASNEKIINKCKSNGFIN